MEMTVDPPAPDEDNKLNSSIKEARLSVALIELHRGDHTNLKQAAIACRVPYGTLHNCFKGLHKAAVDAHDNKKHLGNEQTQVLIDWCKHYVQMGSPFTRLDLATRVYQLSGKVPGCVWVAHFLEKHASELQLGKAQGLDPKRVTVFNETVVSQHFYLLGETLTKYEIPPENIYNEDEKGLQLCGECKNLNRQFIFETGVKQYYVIHSDSLTLVTVIEAVCADGLVVPPILIILGAQTGEWWTVQGVGTVVTSPSGWTDDKLYRLWFEKVFLLHAASRNTSGKHILLITDGTRFFFILSLPTQLTQPLDVGVFGPVQNMWAHQCQIAAVWGSPISAKTVIQEYLAVHNETMTARLVKSAFRCTGIWPFNPALFTLLDFAPAMLTSTHSLGPPSYPMHFPSSPDTAQMTDSASLASQESTKSSKSMAGDHSDFPVRTW
ncbi:hypothetical protein K439DRAFT_1610243 [Ramaria rubella]|nr:hypothetical protein K439DRAFT_1610243 [Ramaria rubella]